LNASQSVRRNQSVVLGLQHDALRHELQRSVKISTAFVSFIKSTVGR
jgi:hypothetical protein